MFFYLYFQKKIQMRINGKGSIRTKKRWKSVFLLSNSLPQVENTIDVVGKVLKVIVDSLRRRKLRWRGVVDAMHATRTMKVLGTTLAGDFVSVLACLVDRHHLTITTLTGEGIIFLRRNTHDFSVRGSLTSIILAYILIDENSWYTCRIPPSNNHMTNKLKTLKNKSSVTSFVNNLADPQRKKDAKALLKIFRETTGMRPTMWGESIIGYGRYHYKSQRSTQEGDWPLVAFSPRKAAMSIYIMPGVKKYPKLAKQLGKFKNGVSCLYIKKLDDIDIHILTKMITKSVEDMKKMYEAK